MRERMGVIFGVSGCLLLLEPDFKGWELLQDVQKLAAEYWPIGLILLGIFLMNPGKKRSGNHR